MSVKWIVENFNNDDSFDQFISEIKAQGMQCHVVKYVPFSDGIYDFYKDNDCVMFFGSLNLARSIQRIKAWIPGPICNFKNLSCLTYYSYWGKYLFNHDYIMLPLLEFSRRREEIYSKFGVDNCVFMRPNSGAKTFFGAVYKFDELDSELKVIDAYAGLPMDEILVVISSPKPIEKEWRVVVSSEYGSIASSLYKENGSIKEEEGSPQEVINIANNIACDPWQPDRIYTVDVCKSNGSFYFLEANSFSCSGLYKCNPKPIIDIASKIALKEWKEYLE